MAGTDQEIDRGTEIDIVNLIDHGWLILAGWGYCLSLNLNDGSEISSIRDRSRSRSPDRPRGRYDERDLDRYFRSGGALPLPFDAPPFRDGRYMLDPRLDFRYEQSCSVLIACKSSMKSKWFRLRYDPRDIRMRDLPIPSYNDRDRMPFDPRRDSRTRSPPPAPYDSRYRAVAFF